MNADHIAFLPYDPIVRVLISRFKDLDTSVKEDVDFLKENPLVLDVPITGYNVRSPLHLSKLIYSMTSKQGNLSRLLKTTIGEELEGARYA